MKWSPEDEALALHLITEKGLTYSDAAVVLKTTLSSIKHKVRRLQQKQNLDKYKHTREKTEQALRYISDIPKPAILETHAGFGGMTQVYTALGDTLSLEIVQERIDAIKALSLNNNVVMKCDSEKYVYNLITENRRFNIIDIDPYGYPSRFFPHIFKLIDDGYLFVTLPMIGVAQVNKITIAHLQKFWGVDYREKELYLPQVIARLEDYAFMHKKRVTICEIPKFDRIYRLVVKVESVSLTDLVGLKVQRNN